MKTNQSVTLCGEHLSGSRHICAFFDSREEQYEVLLPYFKEGIDNNEEVLTIWESKKHDELHSRFTDAGLPVDTTLANGQLKILASEDTYTQDGVFVSERMFNTLEQALADAQSGPYGTVRTCGDMEWALKNLPGTDELMQYEAKVNLLTPKYDCTLLCVYDINKFSGRAIADVLATHSHVILNGRVHVNQHYVEPLEFLKTLIRRKNRPLGKDAEEV